MDSNFVDTILTMKRPPQRVAHVVALQTPQHPGAGPSKYNGSLDTGIVAFEDVSSDCVFRRKRPRVGVDLSTTVYTRILYSPR
jgi:hypothetical protein